MKINQVAAQLYTIRDHLKTPAAIAASLKKVRAMGYQAVQLSSLGPISEKDLCKILDSEGLTCCATHEDSKQILNDPQAVVKRLEKLNCTYTAYPWPADVDFSTLASVKKFAKQLNSAGKVLAKAGKVLTYHNHHIEFRKVDSRLALEVIYDETDPKYLAAEIDTYWVQVGGGNPVKWCKKMKKRLPLLHMKDYGMNDQNQVVMREIGNGNLNWPAIIKASQASGCKWFIVEQDGNWIDNDPFKALKASFDYIKKNLCG